MGWCTIDQFVCLCVCFPVLTCWYHLQTSCTVPPWPATLYIFQLIWLEQLKFQLLAFVDNNWSSFQAGVCSSSNARPRQNTGFVNYIYVLEIHPKFSKLLHTLRARSNRRRERISFKGPFMRTTHVMRVSQTKWGKICNKNIIREGP